MNKHDPQKVFDFLQPIESPSTKRTRTLLVSFSTVILVGAFAGVDIADVKLFGLTFDCANRGRVYLVGSILILFWLVLLGVNQYRDVALNRERKILLDAEIELIKRQYEHQAKRKESLRDPSHMIMDYNLAKAALDAYEDQVDRTSVVSRLEGVLYAINLYIPFGLGICSLIIVAKLAADSI